MLVPYPGNTGLTHSEAITMKYIPIDIVSRLEFCVDFISEVCLGGFFHANYPLLQTRGFVRRSEVVDLYTCKLAPSDAKNEFYTKF